MDGAKVGVLKKRDEVSLNGLLKSTDGRALEAKVRLEVLSDFTDETLEGELADQELGGLLVTTDLTESDGTLKVISNVVVMLLRRVASRQELTRLITMGLLDTTGRRSSFASGLGGELLTGGFASGRLAY